MIPKQRINLVKRQDKKKYAVIDVQNVLIDDYLKNIKEWESAGGIEFTISTHKVV